MKYGYFDDDNQEYIITDPKTPVRWINYIGTIAFGGFVDHTGGCLICKGDPALNRITKYMPQLPASSFNGSTLYLRTKQGSRYKVFSPFFVPTLDPYDSYECHVGLGYTRIVSEFYGIRSDVTIFVPTEGDRVLWDIQLSNLSRDTLKVDVIPVIEYTHPDALKQFTNADWVPQTMQSKRVENGDYSILIQYPFMLRDLRVNYFTSNYPASSFETDRKAFLGDNEYRTWANPLSLEGAELGCSEALRGDNIAALMHHVNLLPDGESTRLVLQLGQLEDLEAALPSIERYRQPETVDAAKKDLADFWQEYLSRCQVETPDGRMNAMLNVHNPRQCYITKNWSRYLSLYQLGYGDRGIGFRDSSQDVLGIMGNAPMEAKELIRMLLRVQKRDGSTMHQFNPITMIANEGDSRFEEEAPKYYSDDHLWIVLAVSAYLKETGDMDFLNEKVPFYDKDKDEQPIEDGSIREHLHRAIEFTRNDTGAHGLPLAGFADWNDSTNLRKGAESLFVANLYGRALLRMIELTQYMGDVDQAEAYLVYYDEMRQRVNQHAWDGDWYLRYFDADGTPLGSKTNTHVKIYANGQSWALLSGFAPPDRAQRALDSVYNHLNTPHGIKLSTPGFDGYDTDKGGVTTYPPGTKENSGIFLHTNPWVMIAETMLGNGDRAFQYYAQINPAAKNESIDQFECEPYVYPQNVLADEHPQFGLARNSWLTGTAAWVYHAAIKYILGIRPTYTGLLVDPCIPHAWDGFKVIREFRDARYEIVVNNPNHVSKGVECMLVDGVEIEDHIIPVHQDGKIHSVVVTLGE
jgi:cellobiose phosphorylase